MTNLRNRTIEALEKAHLMSLGVSDGEGVWVADVIHVYDDDLNIYWMSDPDARHSEAISGNDHVAGTITLSTKSQEPNFGIQFSGTAQKIDGPRYDLAKKHFRKRGRPEPKETDDVLEGDSWYMLKPAQIYLIDEENFGFERKEVSLT